MEARTIVLVAFVFVTVLTAVAVLAAAVGWLPGHAPQLITWGFPAVLGEIIGTVVIFFKGQWAQSININIRFEGHEESDVEIEGSGCTYAVYSSGGQEVRRGTAGHSFGPGGWQVRLPGSVQADQSISLTLRSVNGDTWTVRPFLPLVQSQTAIRGR